MVALTPDQMTRVTPRQLDKILDAAIKARPNGRWLPVLIKGQPGVGKSAIVEQVCQRLKAHLIVSHPVVSEPIDYKGMPAIVKGEALFLPFSDLKQLIDAKKPTVFFLDDLGQAPPAVQAACMQLLLARSIDGHKISDHVRFIAATNRKSDRAGVTGILEPVKSRFATIVELVVDVDDWLAWAADEGMPIELMCYIRWKNEHLNTYEPTADIVNTACPRTVANVGYAQIAGVPEGLELPWFAGAAGHTFAIDYVAFLEVWRSLPDPDAALAHPDTVELPDHTKKPEVLWAFCGAIAKRASEQNAERFFRLAERLPDDFAVVMVTDAERLCPQITKTRGYIKWCATHSAVMLGGD